MMQQAFSTRRLGVVVTAPKEKLFVDYAGASTRKPRRSRKRQSLVAMGGASSYAGSDVESGLAALDQLPHQRPRIL